MRTRSISHKSTDDDAMNGLEMNPTSITDVSALTTTPFETGKTGEASMITADLQHLRLSNERDQPDQERLSSAASNESTAAQGSFTTAGCQDRKGPSEDSSTSEIADIGQEISQPSLNVLGLAKLMDQHRDLIAKGDEKSLEEAKKIRDTVSRTYAELHQARQQAGRVSQQSHRTLMMESHAMNVSMLMTQDRYKAERAAQGKHTEKPEAQRQGPRRSERHERPRGKVSSGRVTKNQHK
jgi:ATP/maltotriose-dependent transcriptional regulator MalT